MERNGQLTKEAWPQVEYAAISGGESRLASVSPTLYSASTPLAATSEALGNPRIL